MSNVAFYAASGALTLGVLYGIALMSKVKTAVAGNKLSAVCMAGAIVLTLKKHEIFSDPALWAFMAIGLVAGLIGAYKVKMIEMPEVVALLNGFGGLASALVAVISMLGINAMDRFSLITAGIALAVGMITFTGSVIAGAKLHKLLPQHPTIWGGHQLITTASVVLTAAAVVAMAIVPLGNPAFLSLVLACAVASGFFGVAFAVRVGGADMPITISLLNSLSGVAGSVAGMAISDPLLVAIGGVVGASGLLLTQIMCRAMNRSLSDILLGKTSVPTHKATDTETANNLPEEEDDDTLVPDAQANPEEILANAKKVIIIPGYGMALAQAQGLVKQFADTLETNGAEVLFAIHPVAGRMPGHMNVLLSEVDVPYDKLYEMDDVNPMFPDCDVAVVIGANDVVNPAANSAEGTPIYGMPVLEVDKAKHIIICNYDLKPGYSGVDNPLYAQRNGVTLLQGDAKQTLTDLLQKFQAFTANQHLSSI
jgi:NAD(P) transhydrogenase subunit beta